MPKGKGYPVDKTKGSEFRKKSEQDYEGTRKSVIERLKSKSADEIDRIDKETRRGKEKARKDFEKRMVNALTGGKKK